MQFKFWVIIIGMGALWGTSFVFNEIMLRDLGPMTISAGRVGFGAIGCLGFALVSGKNLAVPMGLALGIIVLGAFNFALPFAVYPIAQQYIPSGLAGIINAITPIMVVIVSHFWPNREKATIIKTIGVLFGFAGIIILIAPSFSGGGGANLFAILFTLLAPVSYAIAFNLMPKYKPYDPTVIVALALSGGTILIAPLAFILEGVPAMPHVETWASLAFVGFVLTSATFIAMYRILPMIGATNASIPTIVAPVSAVILGSYIMGEDLGPAHIVGMVVIIIGMIIIDGRLVVRFLKS